MNLNDLKAAIGHAERGSGTDLGKVLRAIVNGDVQLTDGDFQTLTLGGTLVTPSAAELNVLDGQTFAVEAGAGITGGTGTVYRSSVVRIGGVIKSSILLDLTGLASSTTDLDIIGQGASVAHIGQITAARNGTILTGRMTCLEAPAGGVADIDIYAATEGTGVFDASFGALTETALLTAGDTWTIGEVKVFTGIPAADAFLYLAGGAAGTAATYTAGKFLIELEGYAA